jgi:hypothetical protein
MQRMTDGDEQDDGDDIQDAMIVRMGRRTATAYRMQG